MHFNPYFFSKFFKKSYSHFLMSVALRSFAIGMINIFIPIYLFKFFNESLISTFLYLASVFGMVAVLSFASGKIISKLGFKWTIFISNIIYFCFFLVFYLLEEHFLLVPLSVILWALGFALYWNTYHIVMLRQAANIKRGEVASMGKIFNLFPTILSPFVGGIILSIGGYSYLFTSVLVVLLSSIIPIIFTNKKKEKYTDSFFDSVGRIFKKSNKYNNVAFLSQGLEDMISSNIWPIFLSVSLFGYFSIGYLTSISIMISAVAAYFVGKMCVKKNRRKNILKKGSHLMSLAHISRLLVINPFTAVIVQSFYRISQTIFAVPFDSIMYEDAYKKGEEGDEFIIYRSIILNSGRFISLICLSLLFYFVTDLRVAFVIASIAPFGFIYLTKKK